MNTINEYKTVHYFGYISLFIYIEFKTIYIIKIRICIIIKIFKLYNSYYKI